MRYRRKRGGAWLPVNPTVFNTVGKTYFEDFQSFPPTPQAGDGVFEAIPLTLDNTLSSVGAGGAGTSLKDYVEGQEYTLNRVVGKVWAGLTQDPDQEVIRCIACVGLAVLPTEPGGNQPAFLSGDDWNPLASENAQEPWLWRRTWVLTNQFAQNNDPIWPTTQADYGSVADGGHLDTKGTKRRITREHRLYIILGADVLATQFSGEGSAEGGVTMGYDVRLNGAMRRATNRSSF